MGLMAWAHGSGVVRISWIAQKDPFQGTRSVPAPSHMDSDPFLHARRVLEGTADVEAGFIHSAGVGDSEKESALSVVEVLDEVRHTLQPSVTLGIDTAQALNSPLCPPDLRKQCLVALPTLCATYGMLPSRCLPAGHLIVNHQSTICVGGADVRSGALDGLMVTVRTIPYTSGGYISQEVR